MPFAKQVYRDKSMGKRGIGGRKKIPRFRVIIILFQRCKRMPLRPAIFEIFKTLYYAENNFAACCYIFYRRGARRKR
jgi:hypothetical protein